MNRRNFITALASIPVVGKVFAEDYQDELPAHEVADLSYEITPLNHQLDCLRRHGFINPRLEDVEIEPGKLYRFYDYDLKFSRVKLRLVLGADREGDILNCLDALNTSEINDDRLIKFVSAGMKALGIEDRTPIYHRVDGELEFTGHHVNT